VAQSPEARVPLHPETPPLRSDHVPLHPRARAPRGEESLIARLLPSMLTGATAGALAGVIASVIVLAATARSPVPPPITPSITEPPVASPISLTARPSTTLSVESTPVGASVRVDGALVGITPIARIEVEPGSHALALELAGHAPHLANVAITEGERERVAVTLEVAAVVEAPEPRAPRASGGGFSRGPPPRDCYRERTECVRGCESSGTRCEMSCFGCSVCNTSYTSEQCSQMCRQCQDGCERNEDFCTDQCEQQERACEGR
jgi:hypothetical protein